VQRHSSRPPVPPARRVQNGSLNRAEEAFTADRGEKQAERGVAVANRIEVAMPQNQVIMRTNMAR